MKKDFRKQTFSKPAKPNDDEIKKLTADEIIENPVEKVSAVINENSGDDAAESSSAADSESTATGADATENSSNPFLLPRGRKSAVGVEKTGYRVRSEFMDLLKLVKRMKKGHTLEAILDDALSFYFENSEDGKKAAKQRQMLDFEDNG